MRTYFRAGFFWLALFAAGAARCDAAVFESIDLDVHAGLNLVCNPLKPADGNYDITNMLSSLPEAMDAACIYKWGGRGWSATIPTWIAGYGWDPGATMNWGEAFFLNSPVKVRISFAGVVGSGTVPYTLVPGINLTGTKSPVDQEFPGADIGNDGDLIFTWTGFGWSGEMWTYIAGYGWSSSGGARSTNGPVLRACEGCVYVNTGPAINWTRNVALKKAASEKTEVLKR